MGRVLDIFILIKVRNFSLLYVFGIYLRFLIKYFVFKNKLESIKLVNYILEFGFFYLLYVF